MKFKVGDKVKIKTGEYWHNEGEKARIIKVRHSDEYDLEWLEENTNHNDGKNWEAKALLKFKEVNMKNNKWLVVWDEDVDPCEFFETEEEADEKIEELLEDDDVVKDSIKKLRVDIKKVYSIKQRKFEVVEED